MRIRHISLPKMAAKMVANHKAYELVPPNQIVSHERYVELVEDALRKERIRLTDEQFRSKYLDHLAFIK